MAQGSVRGRGARDVRSQGLVASCTLLGGELVWPPNGLSTPLALLKELGRWACVNFCFCSEEYIVNKQRWGWYSMGPYSDDGVSHKGDCLNRRTHSRERTSGCSTLGAGMRSCTQSGVIYKIYIYIYIYVSVAILAPAVCFKLCLKPKSFHLWGCPRHLSASSWLLSSTGAQANFWLTARTYQNKAPPPCLWS